MTAVSSSWIVYVDKSTVIKASTERTPVNWEEELRLGDLFIEAFYNCGYINIDYPARRDSSHIVKVAIKWAELSKIPESDLFISLQATELAQPPSIKAPNTPLSLIHI